jgi:serine/threonine protein kinase
MANLEAATVGLLAVRLGLATPERVQQVQEEVGPGTDPEPLLRALERKGYLTPYQSFKLLKGDQDGYFLGGYRLLYKIASGSFGRVFRADDPRTGEVVAIKVLRRRWSDKPHNIEMFEREGKMGLSLRHPNIVNILAVNRDLATQQYYIVMEFVEGGNLRDFLAIRKKLEPDEALALLEDAASGLAYAYSRGVTHRDMKLTNVLISSQGAAKLVDFGLAGLFGALAKEEEGHLDRTVDYAGLERATGVEEGDVRSDIYFLGCVFYEMLTGRPPILMTRDKVARMQRERFLNVQSIAPNEVKAPPLVFHLLETMMAFHPKDRYQTPAQLLEAVRLARKAVGNDQAAASRSGERSVFLVEKDQRLRDVIRDKLKEYGYRVFAAGDPLFARDRFRHRPFDALVVDASTVGEDGLLLFEHILKEAERQKLDCYGILILAQEQQDWAQKLKENAKGVVMVRPVTLRQLTRKLRDLVPPG